MNAGMGVDVERLVVKLKTLPLEQQKQVLDFVEFLAQQQTQPNQENFNQTRVLGLHEGMGWVSEDFNEPLPDEFWMGEA